MALVLTWLVVAADGFGYMVGLPHKLEQLAKEADLVFKGTAMSTRPITNGWFDPISGYRAVETIFKVVSVFKGDGAEKEVRFLHYDIEPKPAPMIYSPQEYHFEPGKTYVVFASSAGEKGVFRQLFKSHTGKVDEGAWLCADEKPLQGTTVQEVVWNELMRMLTNSSSSNVVYSIAQLDSMSAERKDRFSFGRVAEFDHDKVLSAVRPLMASRDTNIARTAIVVIGSHNPYFSESAEGWLATVGSGPPGWGTMDPHMTNSGGARYAKELIGIANSSAPATVRSAAILALGLVRQGAMTNDLDHWEKDAEPSVRAAAAVLMADYPQQEVEHLRGLASDPNVQVRGAVAKAIGFGQQSANAEVLAKLLSDSDRMVRRAASQSLLSFSPLQPAISNIFRSNLGNREFEPLFLNALARQNPAGYLDGLAEVIETKVEPTNWTGGKIPAFDAWEILFKYLQSRPKEQIVSGKFDRYLDAIEKVGNYSSSEPRDIYAFYLQRGMKERARQFRERATKAAGYDLNYYFNQADANPSLYQRE